MRRAEEIGELHTWGVCQLLLEQVRQEVFSDPVRAVETAHLAVRLSEHLGDPYDPDWVLELRARSLAHLGNARRVLGEFQAAEDSFLLASELLEKSGAGNPGVAAEVLSLKGSLRLDQRRLDEALDLITRAETLYREAGNPAGVAKALLKRSKILNQRGQMGEAIAVLQAAGSEIDPARELVLFASARQNLLYTLTLAGRFEEAAALLPEVQMLFRNSDGIYPLRLRWTEGNLAQGLGRAGEAEEAYRSVQSEFLRLGKGLDAALVSLDLASILAEQGRTEELKVLAGEMMAVFDSREIHREALAALLLFQQACREERLTSELIRQIGRQLRREATPPTRSAGQTI